MAIRRSQYEKIRAQAGRSSALSAYSSTIAKRTQSAEDDAIDEQYTQGLLPIDQYLTSLKQRTTRVYLTPLQRQNINQRIVQLNKDYEDSQIQTAYKTGGTFNNQTVDTQYLLNHEKSKLDTMQSGSEVYNAQYQKVAQLQDKLTKEQRTSYRVQKNLDISNMPEDNSARLWEKAKLYSTLEDQARLDGDSQQADIFATSKNNYQTAAKNADITDELNSARLDTSQTPTEGRGVPSAAAGAASLRGGYGPANPLVTTPPSQLTVGQANDLLTQSGVLNGKPTQTSPKTANYESLIRMGNLQSLIDGVSADYVPGGVNSKSVESALKSYDTNTKRIQLLNSQKRDKQILINKYQNAIAKAPEGSDLKTSLTIAFNNHKDELASIDDSIAKASQDREDIASRVDDVKQKAIVASVDKDVLGQEHDFNRTDTQLDQDFQKGKINKAEYVVKKLQNSVAKQKFYQTVSDVYASNDQTDKAQAYVDKLNKEQIPQVQKYSDVFSNYDRYEPVVDSKAGKNVELKDVGADKDSGVFNQKYALVGGKYYPIQNDLTTGASGKLLSKNTSQILSDYNNSSYIYTRDANGKLTKQKVAYVTYQDKTGNPVRTAVPVDGKGGVRELIKSGYYKGNMDATGNLNGEVKRNYSTAQNPSIFTALKPNIDLAHPIQSAKQNIQQNLSGIFNAGKKVTDFFTNKNSLPKQLETKAGSYLDMAQNAVIKPAMASDTTKRPVTSVNPNPALVKGTQKTSNAAVASAIKTATSLGVNVNDNPDLKANLPYIVNALKEQGILTPNVLSYALATVQHETAGTYAPVREGFYNDQRYGYDSGFTGKSEAEKNGYSGGDNYYGRGYIQLTHDYNYKDIGRKIGLGDELYKNPDLALRPDIAAKILATFFKEKGVAAAANTGDFIKARLPINGSDQADNIAKYAQAFKSKLPTNFDSVKKNFDVYAAEKYKPYELPSEGDTYSGVLTPDQMKYSLPMDGGQPGPGAQRIIQSMSPSQRSTYLNQAVSSFKPTPQATQAAQRLQTTPVIKALQLPKVSQSSSQLNPQVKAAQASKPNVVQTLFNSAKNAISNLFKKK